jgi:hypothetical protein
LYKILIGKPLINLLHCRMIRWQDNVKMNPRLIDCVGEGCWKETEPAQDRFQWWTFGIRTVETTSRSERTGRYRNTENCFV